MSGEFCVLTRVGGYTVFTEALRGHRKLILLRCLRPIALPPHDDLHPYGGSNPPLPCCEQEISSPHIL